MSANNADELLGVRQAAAELGLEVAMVRRYCAHGVLPAQLVGKTYVIHRIDLEDFKRKGRRPVGRPVGR